ncbi:monocarboxylate transporter 10-like [Euwallacea similis]|uniref:monocarboxylate transporter 10-like n=1 Tax=Euwallacea similis TaxID=1736056 RepID=UPI0034505578
MAAANDEHSSTERSRPCGLSRSRSLPQFSHHDSGLGSYFGGSGGDEHQASRTARFVADIRQLITLKQHYYPEGGWGWIVLWTGVLVHILANGFIASVGIFQLEVIRKFGAEFRKQTEWLGALSTGISLLISPIVIAFCRTRSTRVTAVMGGLITALGCLFSSFATQFHQLIFSYGTVIGIGVGVTRDCSTLMVAQYFKRRREFVEVFVVSGTGIGMALMSVLLKVMVSSMGWRLGLQGVTGTLSITFILGTFYRSASLYHPQRRAILHIKNQKRKIREKNRADDKPPFFDLTALKSTTVRILLFSTAITSFGINTPLFYLAYQAKVEGLDDWIVLIQVYLGLACSLGCIIFSTLVLHKTSECRVARQYLCQSAVFMCGLSVLAFTVVNDNYHAYVMFAWIYGFFFGGYCYSLKMYTYERVRARHFSRTWGFVQFSQAVPIAIGIPLSGYLNDKFGNRTGYYFSSVCTLLGSLALFLTDLHRHRISHKHTRENGTRHLCLNESCPQTRKLSFTQEPENDHGLGSATAATAFILSADMVQNHSGGVTDNLVISAGDKGELTCISEEGIADMDLPDDILDDLSYIGDCITSCNKVENYLMLSEFENNLIAEMPSVIDKKGRRWSLAGFLHNREIAAKQEDENVVTTNENSIPKSVKKSSKCDLLSNKVDSVLDESAV